MDISRLSITILLNILFPCYCEDKGIPKLILISMDSMGHTFLDRMEPDKIKQFSYMKANGVTAKWIENMFPSVTYTNHYTMITGLYPESHGIVHNRFYDPNFKEFYNFHYVSDNYGSKWYDTGAEPIYVTNVKNGGGRFSGSIGFPAGVAQVKHICPDRLRRDYFYKNMSEQTYDRDVDEFVSWFTDKINPINLGLLYFPEPDEVGHHHGVNSQGMRHAIARLDEALERLIKKLKEARILEETNIILTADHGQINFTKVVANLDNCVNRTWYTSPSKYQNRVAVLIDPVPGKEDAVYEALKKCPHVIAYRKGSKELTDLHYSNNDRIPEIVLEPEMGAIIVNNETISEGRAVGLHGYDPAKNDELYPFFIAMGPAFKKGYKSDSIKMVDLYPLMCHILGVQPAPNNGSLDRVMHILKPQQLLGKAEKNFQITAATFLTVVILVAMVAGIFSIYALVQVRRHRRHRGLERIISLGTSSPSTKKLLSDNFSDEDDL